MQRIKTLVFALALTAIVPASAFAQATITGTVKDASGAVMPGVTVEATGPALLAPRSVVTETNGVYRILDLPPGIYKLDFSLTGFTRVVREGIEVAGSAVFTIGVEMKVGALAETITVTGETPVVDVQSARREVDAQRRRHRDPPGHARLRRDCSTPCPGMTVDNNGLANTPTMTFFTARGGNTNEGRMAINGMVVAAAFNGGGVSSLTYDANNVEEVSVVVSGGLGETESAGR